MDSLSARGACVDFCSLSKTIKRAAGSVRTAPLIKISKFKEFKGWKEEVTALIRLIFQIVQTTRGYFRLICFGGFLFLYICCFENFTYFFCAKGKWSASVKRWSCSVCLFGVSAPT